MKSNSTKRREASLSITPYFVLPPVRWCSVMRPFQGSFSTAILALFQTFCCLSCIFFSYRVSPPFLPHRNISAIQISAPVIAILRDVSFGPQHQLLLWTCRASIDDGSVALTIFLDKEALLHFILALNYSHCFSNA